MATKQGAAGAASPEDGDFLESLLKHCTFDNPVFCHGLFWTGVLIVTFLGTLYYQSQEAREAAAKKDGEGKPKERMIQPLARPIEKRVEVPVEPASKGRRATKQDQKAKPEPVKMVEQVPSQSAPVPSQPSEAAGEDGEGKKRKKKSKAKKAKKEDKAAEPADAVEEAEPEVDAEVVQQPKPMEVRKRKPTTVAADDEDGDWNIVE